MTFGGLGIQKQNDSLGDKKTTIIPRRLDFWLVDNALQEEIDQADIKSEHSAILLSINEIEEQIHHIHKGAFPISFPLFFNFFWLLCFCCVISLFRH